MTQAVSPTGGAKTVGYGFDGAGQRLLMVDPNEGRYTYGHDEAGQLSSLVRPQNQRTTFTSNAVGLRTLKELHDGSRVSFTFDKANQLTQLAQFKSDDTVILQNSYRHDGAGNRTDVLEADGARVTWAYDRTNQLTSEHRSGDNAFQTTFTYDPVGNRLVENENGALTTSTFDAANQLKDSKNLGGTTDYTFDEDGNQRLVVEPGDARTTNVWDFENRLTGVQQASGARVTAAYNADGIRVTRRL